MKFLFELSMMKFVMHGKVAYDGIIINMYIYLGQWMCVDIDGKRPLKFRLPSLHQCLTIKPSDLIAEQLTLLGHPDFKQNRDHQVHTDVEAEIDDEYADMPHLEREDDDGHPMVSQSSSEILVPIGYQRTSSAIS